MSIARTTLSLCLSLFVVACGDAGTNSESSPEAPAGGKADDAGTCEQMAEEFFNCLGAAPDEVDCGAEIVASYPDGASCCVDAPDDDELCALFDEPLSCDDIADEYANCSTGAPEEVDCDAELVATYPDAGACCGHDWEDYEFCGLYDEPLSCDDVEEEYLNCSTGAPAEVDCEAEIVASYPDGGACCGHDWEDYEMCAAYE